ncbi:hypothetical protein TNCV_4040841 [Trichonephila clavipes]|nr:hypothetical protein TNCV_4040841 [Trichonephila clavipes]
MLNPRSNSLNQTTALSFPPSRILKLFLDRSGRLVMLTPQIPIFPTIFTNVIQIANDEGVDEELLARVFRAALRKLSHPDDKACEIFQVYAALKNGRNYVTHNSA